jgi:phage gpG-like protein
MANFSVKIDDKAVRIAIEGMGKRVKDLRKPLTEVAKHLKASVRENIAVGGRYSSAGSIKGGSSKWLPLKHERVTASGKKSPKQTPLLKSGLLRKSIYANVVGNGIVIGSPMKYAAIQNYGGKTKAHKIEARNGKALRFFPNGASGGAAFRKSVKHPGSVIPARPFLVVQESDLEYMKKRLLSHIMGE